MSVFKKIASAFVEIEEKDKKIDTAPKTVPSPIYIAPTEVVKSMTSLSFSPEYESFRKKFSDILSEENKRNYPGNDYFEFKVMKDAMASIPQEDLRYKAAFAGWSTGGNQSKESLLSTAGIYLRLVENEINAFEEAYKIEYEQQIVGNQKLIDSKTKEIQEMVERINLLNSEVSKLKEENLHNTSHLQSKHDTFMAAGNAQKEEILTEIDKIKQYIN